MGRPFPVSSLESAQVKWGSHESNLTEVEGIKWPGILTVLSAVPGVGLEGNNES